MNWKCKGLQLNIFDIVKLHSEWNNYDLFSFLYFIPTPPHLWPMVVPMVDFTCWTTLWWKKDILWIPNRLKLFIENRKNIKKRLPSRVRYNVQDTPLGCTAYVTQPLPLLVTWKFHFLSTNVNFVFFFEFADSKTNILRNWSLSVGCHLSLTLLMAHLMTIIHN